jgi:hypothetical protein
LLNISDPNEMARRLKEMSLSMLEELRSLPERVTDPHWLETLEKDGERDDLGAGTAHPKRVQNQEPDMPRRESFPLASSGSAR